jgi:hypothetical protein
MRPTFLIAAIVILPVLIMPNAALSQGWIDYTSKTDFFYVNFPGQPNVRDITYTTGYDISLPGHVYSVDQGASHYSVTVVDYADTQKIHTAKADECKKKGGEGDECGNPWAGDVQGALVYASWQFIKRNAKVTDYEWANSDQVGGHRLQLMNPDGSRTFAAIHMHGTRLYILEATVPRGAPAPGLFQQSLMFIDEEGKPIRYRSIYNPGYTEAWKFPAPPPPRAR